MYTQQEQIGDTYPGSVYIIDYGDGQLFKIGMTTGNVEKRFHQIARGTVLMPMNLVMEVLVPNAKQLENILHLRFETHHVRGEWFRFDWYELLAFYEIVDNLGIVKLHDRWFSLMSFDMERAREYLKKHVTPPLTKEEAYAV